MKDAGGATAGDNASVDDDAVTCELDAADKELPVLPTAIIVRPTVKVTLMSGAAFPPDPGWMADSKCDASAVAAPCKPAPSV